MLINAPTVEFLSSRRIRVSWTGTANLVAWIFLNGLLVDTPRYFDAVTARSVDLDVGELFVVEVHESEEGQSGAAISEELSLRPLVLWTPKTGAERYLLYHKPTAAGSERLLTSMVEEPGKLNYEYQSRSDLRQPEAQWNYFRVESINARGNESVRSPFPFWIPGLPKPPVSMALAGAAGVFTLTLAVA